MTRRQERLNSLLREVIADVITSDVDNPDVQGFLSVTRVEITADLQFAKVFISVIGSEAEKTKIIKGLKDSAGFIGVCASKEVRIRHFPSLTFHLDDSAEKLIRIEEIVQKIHNQQNQ